MWIVEGLEDGKIALVTKMHHSTIDGVSGAELLGILFDLQPDPPSRRTRPSANSTAHPLGLELVSQAMVLDLVGPFEVGRMTCARREHLRHPGHPAQRAGRKAALPLTAPRTSINVAVTPGGTSPSPRRASTTSSA